MSDVVRVFIYTKDAQFTNYEDALKHSGLSPVLSGSLSDAESCAALLLPGGGDIDPALFHQKNCESAPPDRTRDAAEMELVRLFAARQAPILGICRGLQVLNVAFGGDLIQDIATAGMHRGYTENGKPHDRLHPSTASGFLAALYGERFTVNSSHHQAAGCVACGLRVIQRADDGVVEGLAHETLPIIAVQWHPERLRGRFAISGAADGDRIFDYFRKLCEETFYGKQSAGGKS